MWRQKENQPKKIETLDKIHVDNKVDNFLAFFTFLQNNDWSCVIFKGKSVWFVVIIDIFIAFVWLKQKKIKKFCVEKLE